MKLSRSIAVAALLLAVTSTTYGDDAKDAKKDFKDRIVGKWQSVKGTIDPKYTFDIQMYMVSKFGQTWGNYWITQLESGLVDQTGKKLPPTDIGIGNGSYSIEGDKFTIVPGALPKPFGKSYQKTVWTITKATDDRLIFTNTNGKTEEFKRKAAK